jgi:hypothetical protein
MKLTSLTQVGSGLLLAVALTGNMAFASPSPINGSITFNGTANTNSGDLLNATSFTSFAGVTVVNTDTGSYAGLTGDAVTFTPFSFNAGSVSPLWTFTVSGITYSFVATSINIESQTTSFLNLEGNGVASITGEGSVNGTWSITDTGNGAPSFSFGAGTTVPDGGSTALLMSLGLAGVALWLYARNRKFMTV